jgi:hypothetical protein
MSDTPETDAFYASLYTADVPADMIESVSGDERNFCRKLERERNEARAELSKIFNIVRQNHPDGFIDSFGYAQNVQRCLDRLLDLAEDAQSL